MYREEEKLMAVAAPLRAAFGDLPCDNAAFEDLLSELARQDEVGGTQRGDGDSDTTDRS